VKREYTREEVIERIRKFATGQQDPHAAYKSFWDEVLEELEQEPTDRIEYGTDGNAYKLWMSNGKEFEQEPCDDTVSIRKDVLKCRVGKLVVYNVEWLKKHWQMERDIVCGVKPCDKCAMNGSSSKYCDNCKYKRTSICGNCDDFDEFEETDFVQEHKKIPVMLDLTPCDDAISREAAIDAIESWLSCCNYNKAERHIMRATQSILYDLPSVTSGRHKGHWLHKKVTDDYRVTGQCSECKHRTYLDAFCPRCGAEMVEPQESEE